MGTHAQRIPSDAYPQGFEPNIIQVGRLEPSQKFVWRIPSAYLMIYMAAIFEIDRIPQKPKVSRTTVIQNPTWRIPGAYPKISGSCNQQTTRSR